MTFWNWNYDGRDEWGHHVFTKKTIDGNYTIERYSFDKAGRNLCKFNWPYIVYRNKPKKKELTGANSWNEAVQLIHNDIAYLGALEVVENYRFK